MPKIAACFCRVRLEDCKQRSFRVLRCLSRDAKTLRRNESSTSARANRRPLRLIKVGQRGRPHALKIEINKTRHRIARRFARCAYERFSCKKKRVKPPRNSFFVFVINRQQTRALALLVRRLSTVAFCRLEIARFWCSKIAAAF